MISNEPRLYLSVLSVISSHQSATSQSQGTMGSGHLENYEARPSRAATRADYCDDPRRRWKNSLRPLDPGILSDVKNKKKER